MHSLEELLIIAGPPLRSLAFLTGLARLRWLGLWDTKIEDGDLAVLLEMPALQRVQISPHRKHHSHTAAEIARLPAERGGGRAPASA